MDLFDHQKYLAYGTKTLLTYVPVGCSNTVESVADLMLGSHLRFKVVTLYEKYKLKGLRQ